MNGFHGRILDVDLDARQFRIETVADDILKTYLGGKGLGSYLLYERNPAGVDPLDGKNVLIFAAGPATGSAIWGGCRYGVFTKSPLTGLYSESYSGGRVPEAIDAAGFDAVVIRGKSETPMVLSIYPGGALFHEAPDLWGKETYETEDVVPERFGPAAGDFKKRGAVVIGPAGENLVRFAIIANDRWRCAGRTGVGTVMGSKKLKAILFQGDRKRPVFDGAALRAFSRAIAEAGKDHPGVKAYKTLGTPMMVKILNQAGAFPTRYWQEGRYEKWEQIGADALHSRCDVQPRACLKCFMACGRLTTVRDGRHAGLQIEGPEYETIYAFGGLCLIDSIEEIAHLNDLCDRLGLDTITGGNLCAFTIEAARRGRIPYPIDYGDMDAIADLLGKIALREGIGAVLAEGIRFAAKEWGLEEMAVHVKGMEPAGYDPRVLKGMGLGYATSDRGACHLRATFYKPELSGMIKPDQIEGKAEMFADFEDRLTLFDTLILCRFYRDLYTWERLREMIHAVTGLPAGKQDLRAVAASISTLIRRFNIREGLVRDDDRLSPALHRALADSGKNITEDELAYMVREYYRLRGWNDQGIPPVETTVRRAPE
jgi:aldehyde:ferredoxin oxidoreductase